ncbi:PREDICTED: mechanosensitive ion channel protein 10-like [Tarenaya hassleriana]|uniref:mechanosensitive ion channel protein 10-like n=1 Tax=Tarenaya hassleriana TaxID=28532 RepID=UPI00053C20F7|nr:PREDICTED: mechanosensitive ion channel protein 10-like [Tarenaya hassleriana]XP_010536167.1 PREDICTED: mechanosensitive ion channel protein 10-like [Tarenaya hassleriana]XP_010536168.1 PREDICTED: mechanosensitive ion channel protein 10-like [Tarenaya hassleriana]XP_010536169.1 PREDICTED: mechanosensitive ion channel protein 10-like [Tarenaya hassleriana]
MMNSLGGNQVGKVDVVIDLSGEEPSKDDTKRPFPFKEGASMEPKLAGNACKPPKIPAHGNNDCLAKAKSLTRSVYSKPKSRFVEQSHPMDLRKLEEHSGNLGEHFHLGSLSRSTLGMGSQNFVSARSFASLDGQEEEDEDEDEDEEIYIKVKQSREKNGGMSTLALLQLIVFAGMVGALICSLTIDALKERFVWGLEVWKWCVLAMVTFSGMLVTNWFMHLVVFVIEKNFLLRKKVLYFVHGLKKNVQVFIWLGLVLVTWVCLFNHGVKHSPGATSVLNFVRWTLVSLLVGAFLWLVKTWLLKILASKFNVNNFFERIQESIFHQYILQTLSGHPLIEEAERVGREPSTGQLSFTSVKEGTKVKERKVIDVGKVHNMRREKVSAWTMRNLIEAVRTSGLSTISNTLDETAYEKEHTDKEITSEMEAKAAAFDIFRNIAKPGHDYIDEDDLLRFMIKEEVDLVFPLFEGSENGKITRKALTEWVVKVYTGRKALAHSLNDTKTAANQLNQLVAVILVVVTLIIWLLLLEIATTKVLLFFFSQTVALSFVMGSSCKNLFESIVFVFFMHPFDVGDRCVVDGVPLLVEEMNLLTTVFLKLDNEKVFYPNAVLATKPISNYYRSPSMGEAVEFSIAFSTPMERIACLKERIAEYLEQNPHHWQPDHIVLVKAIENVNKIKMALLCMHTITFQQMGERNLRRTELAFAIKRMFEELQIDYSLLPQQVHLKNQ